jgi:hypothetical protein
VGGTGLSGLSGTITYDTGAAETAPGPVTPAPPADPDPDPGPGASSVAEKYRGNFSGGIYSASGGGGGDGTIVVGANSITQGSLSIQNISTRSDTIVSGILGETSWAYVYAGASKIGFVYQHSFYGINYILGKTAVDQQLPSYSAMGISEVDTSDMGDAYTGAFTSVSGDPNPDPDPDPDPGPSTGTGWTWTKLADSDVFAGDYLRIYDICYGAGKFVAAGKDDDGARLFYSADGVNWSAGTGAGSNISMDFYGLAYGDGGFVAVGHSGGYNAAGARSSDGVSWTAISSGQLGMFPMMETAAFGNGVYVAAGIDMSNANGAIFYSSDGDSWTQVAADNTGFTPTDVYGYSQPAGINDIAYGNGRFIAVGNYGQMAWSSNGSVWTAITSNTFDPDRHIVSIAANGTGTWVAGCYGGYLYYSSDNGATWAEKSDASSASSTTAFYYDVAGLCFGNGYFVAVSGMAEIGYSTNGASWTKSVPNPLYASLTNKGDLHCIAYGNGKYVAAGVDRNDNFAIIYSSGQ